MKCLRLKADNCIILVVVVGWVNLQNCEPGWFGSRCSYKCRCSDDRCDGTGQCVGNTTCLGGWFGPECQYADLAYGDTEYQELTDYSYTTCLNDPDKKNVTFTFRKEFIFTWLRLLFRNTSTHRSLGIQFNQFGHLDYCDEFQHVTDGISLDIHCPLIEPVQELTLSGLVGDLCCLHVSGGRNVALRQNSAQSSTYSETSMNTHDQTVEYPANKATDGRVDADFYKGNTCSRTQDRTYANVYWMTIFEATYNVHKYVIYFPLDTSIYTHGLTIISYNKVGSDIMTQIISGSKLHAAFTLVHRIERVKSVYITSLVDHLDLCEVEVYGDSICGKGLFGRDCEHFCNCSGDEECYVSTGECQHHMCPEGFEGVACMACGPEQYGADCQLNCSQFCVKDETGASLCHNVNGSCLLGCESGYQLPFCQTGCMKDMYGQDCEQACSARCAPSPGNESTHCNSINGSCLYGCIAGYIGEYCDHGATKPSIVEVSKSEGWNKVYIMTLMSLMALIFIIMFCLKQRKKVDSVPAEETALEVKQNTVSE